MMIPLLVDDDDVGDVGDDGDVDADVGGCDDYFLSAGPSWSH